MGYLVLWMISNVVCCIIGMFIEGIFARRDRKALELKHGKRIESILDDLNHMRDVNIKLNADVHGYERMEKTNKIIMRALYPNAEESELPDTPTPSESKEAVFRVIANFEDKTQSSVKSLEYEEGEVKIYF